MSRLPIRARLTAAFALAMVLVLVAAAVFVYVRLRSDLDETIDNGLRSRADDAAALLRSSDAGVSSGGRLAEPEESFAQILSTVGVLRDETTGSGAPVLRPLEAARITDTPTFLERRVARVDGTARLLARRVPARDGPVVVVVGTSLEDRDETLDGVLTSFLIGGAVAVVLASGAGYLLAGAGFRPVEAMRRRAEQVSLERGGERLPLPDAHDEIRRLGETLNDMLERLEASFERERRFVADASHELRTPLAVLKTDLETALRTGDSSPETRESLASAADEVDHLAQLADDLLLIARSAEGRLPVRPEPLRVRELLERTGQRFADRAREQGRTITVEAPGTLEAELDPLRARQAVGNLVDNALRHGAGEIELSARERDGAVEIDVSDEGGGFPPELAAHAFERFARGDAGRQRGGSGLGLAIVSAIADAHGGTAAIVNDGRTTVRLRLPA